MTSQDWRLLRAEYEQAEAIEFSAEQRAAVSYAMFDAQLAALQAIARELREGPSAEARRNVSVFTAAFAQMRMAGGQGNPHVGWLGQCDDGMEPEQTEL